ncbi:MAG: oligopeptidase A, partial [Brachymonas sp.]|nr:oligopeptidase A [Brachymonas sp.]
MNASTSIPTPSAAGNALLDFSDLPLFDQITPAQVQPAVAQLLADCQSGLDRAVQLDFPADWQQLALALDVPAERLGRAWGAVGHLKSVHETPE